MIMTKAMRKFDTLNTGVEDVFDDEDSASLVALIMHHAPKETAAMRLMAARDARRDIEVAYDYLTP